MDTRAPETEPASVRSEGEPTPAPKTENVAAQTAVAAPSAGPAATPAAAANAQAAPAAAPAAEPKKAFFATLPGILTAIVGSLTALTGLITALNQSPWLQPKPTPTVTPAPAATEAPTSVVVRATLPVGGLLMDDFSDPHSGWEVVRNEEYSLGYSDGQYRMVLATTTYDVFSEPLTSYEFTDFSVEVEGQQLAGPESAMYGLMVRCQPNRNFYAFAVNCMGSYIVERSDDGIYEELISWTASDAIRPAGEVNALRVDCLGSTMRFYVNGQQLCELMDSHFASGGIGLLASTYDGVAQEVRFDNLQVRSLLRFQ